MHAEQLELRPESNAVVFLARTSRIDSWHRLTSAERLAATNHYVDLMLKVATNTGMRRLDGYRLLAPRAD